MQKLWQKKLKLNYSKDVFDIVQFGSSVVEGKVPKDIDIAIIFNKIPLKEQLTQAQKIKKQLQEIVNLPVHIKSFDLYSLFDKSNFAKKSILFGRSLIFQNYFSQKFGFVPRVEIYYSLKDLKKKDKIKFNYLLSGKKGVYGLLRNYGGELLKPGLIEVLPECEEIFIEKIKKVTTDFKVRKIFSLG